MNVTTEQLLSDETLGEIAYALEAAGWELPANGAETCADLRAAIGAALKDTPNA